MFENLSFLAQSGQFILLRGANGSGKTSLLRLIAGLLKPAEGSLTWTGTAALADSVHWIGPDNPLKPDLTVCENLSFWSPTKSDEKLRDRLAQFDLTACTDQPVRLLSAGQKRRVNLCRLLLDHKPLWLLDEPDNALDQKSTALFHNIMQAHLASGGLIFMASHHDIITPTHTITFGDTA